MLMMQEALTRLAAYWTDQGCLLVQPMNTEVGAGTLNPATALRVLGPEPWRVSYVEPSVRPDDARYGENPNRIQTHTQYQVILKPEPGDAQDRYLGSLAALGVDIDAHDVRFVEDNWASPALGAWGLGWEVWLDGLEITQFTYFQQAGGLSLDPVSVEITYGMERILMALQGARHFKDIQFAPGLTYGELFGQAEYEMSRYYLDEADVAANRTLLETFAVEADRMIDAGLPVPAHTYVLKMSHAFNVLDARGAVSTAERASEFARMRRLSHAVAELWVATRQQAGFPLSVGTADRSPAPLAPEATEPTEPTEAGPSGEPARLVVEIGVEEMPPAEAEAARAQLESALGQRLRDGQLATGRLTVHATPRRLLAIVDDVATRERDDVRMVRGPRVSAAFGPDGAPTKAALGFARSNGVDVAALERIAVGGVEHVATRRETPGRPAVEACAELIGAALAALRSAKNMRWNDPSLSFTRPIRWIAALLGDAVVPVRLSGLTAGRRTRLWREPGGTPEVSVASADALLALLGEAGIVFNEAERHRLVVAGAAELAAGAGGHIDSAGEASLIDQITYLVEQPTPLLGQFDESYLQLPEPVLTTVMRKHQRYLPIRDDAGKLLRSFVVVANGSIDVDTVRSGNEAVLRARFEDASFFYRADLAVPPDQLREDLGRLTFTDKLGSMLDRAERIGRNATTLADRLPLDADARATLARAAQLVKFDLASQMVTELTSLAGTMARTYAVAAGESPAVADALLDTELPRVVGDALPSTAAGAALALADRMDLVIGLAATVGLPVGSSDPFAVRRAALGVLALARSRPELADLSLTDVARTAAALQPVDVGDDVLGAVAEFLARRLEQQFIDEGKPIDRVRAALRQSDRPAVAERLLRQLAELAGKPDFARVAAALQRSRRILRPGVEPRYDAGLLVEPAELRLDETLQEARRAIAALGPGDLVGFVAGAQRLTDAIDEFFTDVLVITDDPALQATRLGLLAAVAEFGATQLVWEELVL